MLGAGHLWLRPRPAAAQRVDNIKGGKGGRGGGRSGLIHPY